MRRPLLIAALAFVPAVASANDPTQQPAGWAVLPVFADKPPPRDPTLLRLTKALAEAVHTHTDARVHIVSRILRDEACPSTDGQCPRDVALHANAERAVSFQLADGYQSVTVRVYTRRGLEQTGTLPCRWATGFATCDAAGLSALLVTKPTPKAAVADGGEDIVKKRFARLQTRLDKCTKLGWGDAPEAKPVDVTVQFTVAEGGRVRDVRLQPSGFDDVPAYACMARVVESMKLPRKVGPIGRPLRLSLPRL